MTPQPTPRDTLLRLAMREKTRLKDEYEIVKKVHDETGGKMPQTLAINEQETFQIDQAIAWLDARGAGER